jgi:hypothetical protein
VNYVLYGLAKTTANVCASSATPPSGCVFNDVVKGNISVACVGGSPNCSNTSTAANQFGAMATAKGGTTVAFNTAAGYDLATGLGSVNVANLLTKFVAPVLTGTITTLSGPPTSTIGASVTFIGTVTSSGTTTPTGLVLLEDQSTGVTIASVSLPASGAFSITTTLLPAAATPYNLIAHYGGDGTFAASDSTPLSMTVPKQNSQVLVSFVNAAGALTTAAQGIPYGSDYILRVDVTNTSGTPCQNANSAITFACPTGSIQLFQSPGTALNDFPNAQNPNATNIARLNDRGFAEDQPIQLAAGSYSITATYTADANSSFNSSNTSNTLSVTVTKATTTAAVTAGPVSVAPGGNVTLTATISSTSNSSVGPGGTVQFINGSTALGSAVTCTPVGAAGNTGASCKATFTTGLSQFLPPGKPRMRPNVPLLPLGMVASLLIVLLAMQRRLSLGKRLGYAAAGLLVFACLAAGFAGCGGSSSSGSTGAKSHTDSITAVYSGDANYSGSTSAAATVTIQ